MINISSKEDLIQFLAETDKEKIEALFNYANTIREKEFLNEVHLRGIIEFSNYCKRNCLYCGLRAANKNVKRYRMSYEQIFNTVEFAVKKLDFKTIVLQSGEDPYYKVKDFANLIYKIKSKFNIAITLSIGEKSYSEYKVLKNAGADRYLLKHETSDRKLYKYLHPDLYYDNRFRCLYDLKQLGYQTGSGNIIGLPGQTLESIANDILLFKELDMDMIGIGPFIANPDTPLANEKNGDAILTLKTIALTRIITKDTHIPSTTALASIDLKYRFKAFFAGANVIMPNITPEDLKVNYKIYPNKVSFYEHISNIVKLKDELKRLGFKISNNLGHRHKKDV